MRTRAHKFLICINVAPSPMLFKPKFHKKATHFGFAFSSNVRYIKQYHSGEMAERSKATVSKIVIPSRVSRVRIPLSPPFFLLPLLEFWIDWEDSGKSCVSNCVTARLSAFFIPGEFFATKWGVVTLLFLFSSIFL